MNRTFTSTCGSRSSGHATPSLHQRDREGIYAVGAILMVIGNRFVAESLWAPTVIYMGPALYFIAVAAVNRSAFGDIRSATLRWTALVAACSAMTAVSTFLVFVLAVNVHLALGGRM